jgi:F5/8 type C domain.
MIGGKIQATNDHTLKTWDTLYEIQNLEYPDKIPSNVDTKYRYWRFVGRRWAYMNIAEFHLYKDDSESLVNGKILGTEGFLNNDSTYDHSKAFDGDWLTYYHSPEPLEEPWIGVDLGMPETIKYLRCVPRSDDNGIHYGDTYELVYWQDGGWKSLGKQRAREKHLVFDPVPDNALLLLNNLTQGREERIFTFENDSQIWR